MTLYFLGHNEKLKNLLNDAKLNCEYILARFPRGQVSPWPGFPLGKAWGPVPGLGAWCHGAFHGLPLPLRRFSR